MAHKENCHNKSCNASTQFELLRPVYKDKSGVPLYLCPVCSAAYDAEEKANRKATGNTRGS